MPRKFLKRYLPSPADLTAQRSLGMFGRRLADPDLWHLNRRSVSTAAAVGLFLAFFPVPGQMIFAVLAALRLRCNLPLSFALVWITNPLTMPPILFFAYKLGAWVLDIPPTVDAFALSWDWLVARVDALWAPLLVGSLICAVTASALGWSVVQLVWRVSVVQRWEKRRTLRRLRAARPETGGEGGS
jgi:uncharacterized protein (DUF2062 family)